MIPTITCLTLAGVIWHEVGGADSAHRLSADFALLWLVLLFRALKDFIFACFPRGCSGALLFSPGMALFVMDGGVFLWNLAGNAGDQAVMAIAAASESARRN